MTRLDCGIGLYEVGACLGRSWKDRRPWLGRGRVISHAEGARRVDGCPAPKGASRTCAFGGVFDIMHAHSSSGANR